MTNSKRKLTDKELGEIHRRVDELKRRITEGTFEFPFVIDGLQAIVEGGDRYAGDYYNGLIPEIKTWKTVSTGLYSTGSEYLEALKNANVEVLSDAEKLIPEMSLVGKQEYDLVLLSTLELGFPNGATLRRTLGKAKDLGLEPCPPEVALALRLMYLDQQNRDEIMIGMEPLLINKVYEVAFDLRHHGSEGLLLGGYPTQYKFVRSQSTYWVFVKPRN